LYTLINPFRNLWVLLDPLNTLLDVLGEVSDASVEEALLVVGDLADGVDLLNTVGAELNVGGEVVAALVLEQRRVDKGGLDDVLLALGSLEERLGETGTGHGHGESGRTSTVLGLDDLVTTELDTVDVVLELLALKVVAGLGEEGNDGSAGVTADDSDVLGGGVGVLQLGDEAGGTDNVKGGDTKETLGVVDALGLEDLGGDGDGGIDLKLSKFGSAPKRLEWTYGVGDDEDVGLGSVVSDGLGEVADDGGVGVEQVCCMISGVQNMRRFHAHHHGSCRACGEHQRG
jgi:hypothetical protein